MPQFEPDDFLSGVFPTSQRAALKRSQERSAQLEAFRRAVLEQMQSGTDLKASALRALDDPEIAKVLAQDDFPKSAQEFMDLITPAADEFGTIAAGASVLNKTQGTLGAQAPSAPSAAEKLVDAILAAPEGSEERKLLERGLAGTDGRLGVKDYLTLVSAGAKPDPELIPKAVTVPVDPKRAAEILALGSASGPRAPNGVDMFMAALGIKVPGSPLNTLSREEGQQMMLIREELAKQGGAPDLASQVIAAMGGGGAPGALSGDTGGGLGELFEKFNKATPGEGVKAPGIEGTQGQVPILGDAPQVGGTQGQAPGPRVESALRPDQIKAIEAMAPESFAELSPETLKQIVDAVIAKTLKLSEEQKAALIAANGARLGRAN